MSHFGLHLGPEKPFASLLPSAYSLDLFSAAEYDAAFSAQAQGRSELALDELQLVLARVFRGPPPASEAARVSARALEEAGGSGTLGAGAFSGVIAALLAEGAPAGDRSYVAHYTSFDVLRSHKHKEVRPEKGPEETLRVPATQLQTVGWSARDAKPDVRHPKVYCRETKFAESLIRSGVFFI